MGDYIYHIFLTTGNVISKYMILKNLDRYPTNVYQQDGNNLCRQQQKKTLDNAATLFNLIFLETEKDCTDKIKFKKNKINFTSIP